MLGRNRKQCTIALIRIQLDLLRHASKWTSHLDAYFNDLNIINTL